MKEALAQPEQEPVAYFDWLPEGATHLGQLTVNVKSGGALKMRTHAFKYEDDVLMVYTTDNDNEYPGWREAKQCFYHLNFPVFPIPTTPPKRPSEQERVAPTCERCADEIVENNAGLCANCLPAICTEQEPVFKWCSVFQEMPTENSHLLFCFGVHVVEGSYTKKGWASLAYGEAQPDFWAYMPPPPHHKRNQELYAMPPKRPWVGLTDERMWELWNSQGDDAMAQQAAIAFARAIEAKLKELNT